MLLTAAMAALLSSCAPRVGTRTMAAIVQHESNWEPWSIGDDTTGASYHFATQQAAVVAETALLNRGDNLDVGLSQVNSSNFAERRLTPATAFDPCRNVSVGAAIITDDYITSSHTNWIGRPIRTRADEYMQEQYALYHALSSYNSGKQFGALRYANDVYNLGLTIQAPESQSYTRIQNPRSVQVISWRKPSTIGKNPSAKKKLTRHVTPHGKIAGFWVYKGTP